tara:strand:- start:266 stop:481 length:216 start_codon:yes stop_codon:yes gene_type:complete
VRDVWDEIISPMLSALLVASALFVAAMWLSGCAPKVKYVLVPCQQKETSDEECAKAHGGECPFIPGRKAEF